MKEHHAEMALCNLQLQEGITNDTFLKGWLNEIEQFKPIFAADNSKLDVSQREKAARDRGYRTWRQYIEAVDASNRLHHLYVHGDGFGRLWRALKEYDESAGWAELYGPHNGGVPLRLARCLNDWYQVPKFTKAEKVRHNAKIKKLCDELLLLIGQVTPGIDYGDPFRLVHVTDDQAIRLMKAFQSPDAMREMKPEQTPWRRITKTQMALESGGIDAAWCIKNIMTAANKEPETNALPTKIRAKSAFKTYLILKLNKITWGSLGPIRGLHQLIADVVAEVSDLDCSAEDVRKAIANNEAEDSGLKA